MDDIYGQLENTFVNADIILSSVVDSNSQLEESNNGYLKYLFKLLVKKLNRLASP